MIHYVILFRESIVTADTFEAVHLYQKAVFDNDIPDLPASGSKLQEMDFQEAYNVFITADRFRVIDTKDRKFGRPSIDEMILYGIGKVTALFYDRSDKYVRDCSYTLRTLSEKTRGKISPATKKKPQAKTISR